MQPEEIWANYQAGIAYKSSLDLYETVARNERFFAGDQWAGVAAPDLPKPVVNFLKRACQQRVAEVKQAVAGLTQAPSRRLDMILRAVVTALLSGVVGYFLAKL